MKANDPWGQFDVHVHGWQHLRREPLYIATY